MSGALVSFFSDFAATTKGEGCLPLNELRAVIAERDPAPSKAAAPWLKLARFGERASDKGSLRHDANVLEVSGVELDYDGERMAVDEALAMLRAAGLHCLLYTSPSHSVEAPRWRVLAPLRASQPGRPDELRKYRSRMLARLNGVLDGAASGESWTLSQAYFFGRIAGRESVFRCEVLAGDYIDERHDLDAGAIGKLQAASGDDDADHDVGAGKPVKTIEQAQAVAGLHPSVTGYAWRLARKGIGADEIRAVLVPMIRSAEREPERLRRMIEGGELADIIKSAIRKASQSEPVPLMRELPPAAPYPVEALGPILGPAAQAIAEIVQVPLSLAGNSVLAAAALAAQTHANVQTKGGDMPLSLYLLTIAESGARKSTADRIAMAPAKDHQRALELRYRDEIAAFKVEQEAHKLVEKNARATAGESPDVLRTELLKVSKFAPREPRRAFVIMRDPTIEGIARALRDGQYSQGLFNDEGGTVIGGYSLSADSRMRTLAGLNDLWGGAPLNRVRSTDNENSTLHGRRISLHLMAQPGVAGTLFAEPIFRDTGFLARCLIAAPESLAGTRLHSGESEFDPFADPRLARYRTALAALYGMEPITDDDIGGLLPRRLRWGDSASLILDEATRVELAQREGGEYFNERPFAAKAAEHACRIAGVLTLVSNPMLHVVPVDAMAGAITLVRFYLSEQLRLSAASSADVSLGHARLVLEWIRTKGLTEFSKRDVMWKGPHAIREATQATVALDRLVEFGWLVHEGSKRYAVPEAALAALRNPDAA